MRKLIILVGLILLSCSSARAVMESMRCHRISPALLKGANAVLRLEEMRFEINSTKEAVLKNHYVITILNENGDHWAEFSEYYDKHQQIESLKGFCMMPMGKQLKRVKKKDLEDLSGVSDGSLMDDNRIKRHNFYYKVYPYTIEYTVEIQNKSTFFFQAGCPRDVKDCLSKKAR